MAVIKNKDLNLKGKVFGRLTIKKYKYTKNSRTYWDCVCECGAKKTVDLFNLRNGRTKSCGCLNNEVRSAGTHGMSNTKFYSVWATIKQRCLNHNNVWYKNYGGRGIGISKRWEKFENFRDDMYEEYKKISNIIPKCEIDRINNKKGYSKGNCRWVSRTQNINNRDNRKVSMRSLSNDDVARAKSIRNNSKKSFNAISKLFGVCRKTIERAIKGKTYKELN